jgi:hypothetical protein
MRSYYLDIAFSTDKTILGLLVVFGAHEFTRYLVVVIPNNSFPSLINSTCIYMADIEYDSWKALSTNVIIIAW